MSKSNKVLVKDLEKIIKATPDYVQVEWNDKVLNVKQSIGFEEFYELIELVAKPCFIDGVYFPVLKDFLTKMTFTMYFSDAKLPEDNNKKFGVFQQTDLFETVYANVPRKVRTMVIDTIEKTIEARQAEMNSSALAMREISNVLNIVADTFKDVTPDEVQAYVKAIESK